MLGDKESLRVLLETRAVHAVNACHLVIIFRTVLPYRSRNCDGLAGFDILPCTSENNHGIK